MSRDAILPLSSRTYPGVVGADYSSCSHFLAESMAACTPTSAEHFLRGRIVPAELLRNTMSADADVDASANTSNAASRSNFASLA